MKLTFKAIKEILESLDYHSIRLCDDSCDDLKVNALNLFNEDRTFVVSKREKEPVEKYVLKSINNDFMTFENADKVHYIEVEFVDAVDGEIQYICVFKDFLYNKTTEELERAKKLLALVV